MKKAQSYNVIGKAELRNDGAERKAVTSSSLYCQVVRKGLA